MSAILNLTAVTVAMISTPAFAKIESRLPGLPGGQPINVAPVQAPTIQLIPMHELQPILEKVIPSGSNVIDVEAARCDNRGTDCDIQAMSNSGKHIAFEVKKGKGIVFVSSSGRKLPVVNRTPQEEQLMLSLGVALERVAERCKSIVIFKSEQGQLSTPSVRIQAISLRPGCTL